MPTVRIWSLGPDYDAESIKDLANEVMTDLQLENLSIQTANKRALPTHKIKDASLSGTLRKATQIYLEQNDCVIFVADRNSFTPIHQEWGKMDALISQIEQVVNDSSFDGKVFHARAVHDFEVYLPKVCESFEADSMTWQEEWESTLAHFHKAFADTPEDELIRDFEEALAEVRNERT